MKTNTHLQSAKERKDDEFYTRFEDIEKELDSYDWSNKIVGCPADSEENKFIELYSVRNYFTKVLLNYDPSKISFIIL